VLLLLHRDHVERTRKVDDNASETVRLAEIGKMWYIICAKSCAIIKVIQRLPTNSKARS